MPLTTFSSLVLPSSSPSLLSFSPLSSEPFSFFFFFDAPHRPLPDILSSDLERVYLYATKKVWRGGHRRALTNLKGTSIQRGKDPRGRRIEEVLRGVRGQAKDLRPWAVRRAKHRQRERRPRAWLSRSGLIPRQLNWSVSLPCFVGASYHALDSSSLTMMQTSQHACLLTTNCLALIVLHCL